MKNRVLRRKCGRSARSKVKKSRQSGTFGFTALARDVHVQAGPSDLYVLVFSNSMAATRFFEPEPHFVNVWKSWRNEAFTG